MILVAQRQLSFSTHSLGAQDAQVHAHEHPSCFPLTKMESSVEEDESFLCMIKENPFEDAFADPLCKLNLEDTSQSIRAFPVSAKSCSGSRNPFETSSQRRREGVGSVGPRKVDAPSTPGRPVFSFSAANLGRKSIPSKWEDAEKWLNSPSCHESTAHVPTKTIKHDEEIFFQKKRGVPDRFKVVDEKLPAFVCSSFKGIHGFPSEMLLKDKFTEGREPTVSCSEDTEPSKESFLFSSSPCDPVKDRSVEEVSPADRRDIGTEMTPFGSSTTSRCHTPIKTSSPARHNTPADRSGLLVPPQPRIDLSELKGCHMAKLELGSHFSSVFSNWTSKEEEEKEISKSLRHSQSDGGRKSTAESRAIAWDDEEKAKNCVRFQREEAKIQAWLNLESAKAEAKSRKLEVKIEKMRSNLEEKVMKRLASVQRRAEEWRFAALLQHSQHSQQIQQRAREEAQKMKEATQTSRNSHFYDENNRRFGCIPCKCNSSASN